MVFSMKRSPGSADRPIVFSDPFEGQQENGSEKYRHTLDCPGLTTEQREFYEINGFIVFRKLVSPELLDTFSQRFRDICNGIKAEVPGMVVVKDISLLKLGVTGERLVNKIQYFMSDQVLYQYASLPEILKVVRCFTGPNITAYIAQLINKPPDNGSWTSRHPLHQDLNFFPIRPADRIVCAWTAIDKATRENGCLAVVPGSHREPLLPHGYPAWEKGVNNFYHGILSYSSVEHQRVHIEMEKGDCIFFHPLLIHGSGANRTKGYRKSISCHFAASACHFIDQRGTDQEDFVKEFERLKLQAYNDFFRNLGRQVAGGNEAAFKRGGNHARGARLRSHI